MHGNKNDYIFFDILKIDDKESIVTKLTSPTLIGNLCDRYSGIGGDGIVIITKTIGNMIEMKMFNADGGEAEMCGNAIRCVAR